MKRVLRHLTALSSAVLISSSLLMANTASADSPDPADFQLIYQGTWIQPAESTIPNNAEGDMIRYGRTLLNDTYKHLGANSNKPFTGNKLACTNCHLNDGTKPYSGPWMTSYQKYDGLGKFSSRTNENRTLPIRINGCMQRSMAGSQIPEDSYEMQSMVAYFKWLDSGIQVSSWKDVLGTSFRSIADMTRAADPVRGAEIFRHECRNCHGDNGEGEWDADLDKFRYPALWGPDSFNHAAGMNRLRTGVRFIKSNMPYGKENLSDEDAWDVTAFIVSQTRPIFSNHLNDWSGVGPDSIRIDAGYPNYYPRIDGTNDLTQPAMFPETQHRYGPYQELIDMQNLIKETYKLENNL